MNTFASNSWKILRRSGDIERKLASLLSFTNFALLTFLILSLASCLLLVYLVDIALVIVCSSLIFLGPVFFYDDIYIRGKISHPQMPRLALLKYQTRQRVSFVLF